MILTHAALSAWLFARMVSAIPPGSHQNAGSLESTAEHAARYRSIASDIATVALDSEEPPVFRGRLGTAALLLSVSYFESAWRKDVDTGIGKLARGDGGQSCTIYQLLVGRTRCEPLLADRGLATREALHMIRRSALACSKLGPNAALNVYASGSCEGGEREGKLRIEKARKWLRENPLPPPPA